MNMATKKTTTKKPAAKKTTTRKAATKTTSKRWSESTISTFILAFFLVAVICLLALYIFLN